MIKKTKKAILIPLLLLGCTALFFFVFMVLRPKITESISGSTPNTAPDILPNTKVSIVGDISLADNCIRCARARRQWHSFGTRS